MSTAVLGSSAQGYSAPGYSAPANRAYAGERRDAPASHLRLTTRGRVVLAALVALPFLIAGGLAALGGGSATASNESSSSTFDYVQVASGQSLWELAESIAPQADPRDVVSDILHLNQLGSADVQPGQRLAVPEQYSN